MQIMHNNLSLLGTYADSVARKNDLPELSETMLLKLRQLTLVTMCSRSKIFSIESAMRELQITDLQEFQRLFISTVYDGIIQVLFHLFFSVIIQ